MKFPASILLLAGLIIQFGTRAQSDSAQFSITLEQHVGDLIKIHGLYPPNELSYSTNLDLALLPRKNREWRAMHANPIMGLSFSYNSYGNDLVLGEAFTASYQATMRRPITSKLSLIFQPGGGVAWFGSPYHITENPTNLVIGSRFTAMAKLLGGAEYQITDRISLRCGGSFWHYSNSHAAVPNIGANVVGGFIGLRYSEGLPQVMNKSVRLATRAKANQWRPFIRLRLGLHEFPGTVEPRDGPLYKVYGGTFGFSTTSKSRAMWSAGLTYNLYQGYVNYIVTQQLFDDDTQLNWRASTVSIFGGREWCFGRLHFFAELGLNLHSPFQRELNEVWDLAKGRPFNSYVAAKIGYRYYIIPPSKPWHEIQGAPNVGIAVKTNGGTADFLELSVGYTF